MNIQVILRVYLDNSHERVVDVPVTPESLCADVIDCCKQPGDEDCHLAELWRGCERPIGLEEKPFDILQQWGAHRDEVRFYLRLGAEMPAQPNDGTGRRTRKGRNGIREDEEPENNLPSGVDLTLIELQEMASRQQRQIDEQQQMLVAKEQRLRFLKQHELRHQHMTNENERLRKLREKVDAQELKLKKLRALRGHVNEQTTGNNTLNAELEQIKSLFNEKEKELSVAVCKVEDLTRQLDELRNGRINGVHGEHNNNAPAFIELDKLRKELMIRNKLNEQQGSKIAAHREILNTRTSEMTKMDERIAELQLRLRKKKQLQEERQQPNHKAHNNRIANQIVDNKKLLRNVNNVAAVEPYVQNPPQNVVQYQEQAIKGQTDQNSGYSLSKQDSKYQSLPYSIKFPGHESKTNQLPVRGKPTQASTANRAGPVVSHAHISTGPPPAQVTNRAGPVVSHAHISTGPPPAQVTNRAGPLVSHAHISTGPPPAQVTNHQPKPDSPQKVTRHVSPRPTSSVGLATSFAPKPYGRYTSSLQAGTSVTSVVTTVAHASPSVVYSSSTGQSSTPHTSTPVLTEAQVMREIFITGAPVVTAAVVETAPQRSVADRMPAIGAASNVAAAKSPPTPVYQLANSKPVPQAQHATSPAAQSTHKPPSPVSSQTVESLRGATNRNTSESQQRLSQSNVADISARVVQGGGTNGLAGSQSRALPPPYDYPHHRKPGHQNGSKSESASALPLVDADATKALQRQAISDSHLVTSKDPSVCSALNVLKSGAVTSSQAPPARPRYASRSVIANTYMNKLSSNALDQYRKNMSMLYDTLPAEGADRAGSAPVKVQPMLYDPSTATGRDEQASPGSHNQSENRDSPTTAQTYPGHEYAQPAKIDKLSNGPHGHYPTVSHNIEPERSKFRPNAPRPLRRRLSSGGDSPVAVSRTEVKNEARGMFYEEEKTSFSTQDDGRKSPVDNQSQSDTSPTPITQPSPNQVLDPPDLIRVDVIRTESLGEEITDNTNQSSYGAQVENIENIPFADEDSKHDSPVKCVTQVRGGIFLKPDKPRRNVKFDPLALLLDAALEGELQLVVRSAHEVTDPSEPNDEGITALHNAICAGHFEIVKFLVEYGCNVNAPDSDGWTPLHCAASCNNIHMVRILVENGACILATTISDEETAAEKCEEDEAGYRGCSEYLYSIQEKLGIANKGTVYAVFDYEAANKDELSFENGQALAVLRKGDNKEKQWWWAKRAKHEGYVPRNLLGMYPRVIPKWLSDINKKSK